MDPASALILGSTSVYRRQLLERLRVPFNVDAPRVDETPHAGEPAHALASRLALEKAREVATRHPRDLVIGSDQVAELDGECLGKPLTHERAVQQLRRMSSRRVVFHTAVAAVRLEPRFQRCDMARVVVQVRALDDAEIERYLCAERPYDCAGSAKSEGLGIALLDSIESDDPTALVGLPLIRTCALLRAAGLQVP